MKRLILLQMIGGVLLFSAWHMGWLGYFYGSDRTYLTTLISAVAVVGIWALAVGRIRLARYLEDHLTEYGLLGTVIGFSIALSGIVLDDADLKMLGLNTAIHTTIAGLIGANWISINRTLLGK